MFDIDDTPSPRPAFGAQTPTAMGKQRMNDNWERMKTQILSTWNDLDEDELKKARGSLGRMVNLIHDQTGEDRDLIMRKMTAFL